MTRDEGIRRVRLGDLRKLYRRRYGIVMPDDDAGREDLRELLLVASMAHNPERMMISEIAQWAPWLMNGKELTQEAVQIIDDVQRTPTYQRKVKPRELGDRLRLTDYERTTYGIQSIRPFDVTDEELEKRRKAKDALRKWRKRKAKGQKPRDAWLANCKSRVKPWEKRKPPISRATWYREGGHQLRQVRETGVSAVKFNIGEDRLVSVESQRRGKSRKGVAMRKAVGSGKR